MNKTILKSDHFTFQYGNKVAIEDISLNINLKKITSIIGPSGCGKSTYLRSFNRMNELIGNVSHSGNIFFHNEDIYDSNIDVVDLRTKIGMVFQKPNPFPKSIKENILYGPKLHGEKNKSTLSDIVEYYLKKVYLWDEVKDKLNESAFSISGGQQQRLCIARALAVHPEVLLMDEPCSALDPIATLRIEDLMRELSSEVTIMIVTHNMQQAARISDFTAFFNTDESRIGRLIEFGLTKDIFTNPKKQDTTNYITGRFG
ncbi:MAG: phosphate ABC transporter ATP-binding protein [Candidatus Margulisbacteria bacterium GWF2_35_9]|nr:MAG: phosphate ABC transporter ATP-binding protein [Candidatus Margulisbacteria bacterium GWF2_35_9]